MNKLLKKLWEYKYAAIAAWIVNFVMVEKTFENFIITIFSSILGTIIALILFDYFEGKD